MSALLILLLACHRAPAMPDPVALPDDPAALLAAVRAAPVAAPSLARFDIRIDRPDQRVSANGTLIVAPPGRFRLEIRGPIGGPAVIVVSDGATLDAWVASKQTFYHGEQAETALRSLTGEVAGLDAAVALLSGRLPPGSGWTVEGSTFAHPGPSGSRLLATVDPPTGQLLTLDARDAAGATLLGARYTPGPGGPATLDATLPSLETGASLRFTSWEPFAPDDAIFRLAPPSGATVVPLAAPPMR